MSTHTSSSTTSDTIPNTTSDATSDITLDATLDDDIDDIGESLDRLQRICDQQTALSQQLAKVDEIGQLQQQERLELQTDACRPYLRDMVVAEYKYLQHIQPIWQQRFVVDTQDYVWQVDNPVYTMLGLTSSSTVQKSLSPAQADELKLMSRRLSVALHPDKNTAVWANTAFCRLQEYVHTGNIEACRSLYNYWQSGGDIGTYSWSHERTVDMTAVGQVDIDILTLAQLQDAISTLKKQLWYVWYADTNYGPLLRLVYCRSQ